MLITLILVLLTSSVLATETRLSERLLFPDKSRSFSPTAAGKMLSFNTSSSKSFPTFQYSKIPTSLIFNKSASSIVSLKTKKITFYPWINLTHIKIFPLKLKQPVASKTIFPIFPLPSSKFAKKLPLPSQQPFSKKPPSSSLYPIIEKMNKKMSLDDLRELLNHPR